ncbi:UNVERIFIED_CONTAM: hypothetical protein K2H54_073360 [Gekko kuhli]
MASPPGLRFHSPGLFLVLLCGCVCFQGTDAKPRAFIRSPLQIRASFGQSFRVPCEGYSTFGSCSIYWLANSSFVEDLYPDGAVSEEEAIETSRRPGRGRYLSRELVFHAFSQRDLQTTFRCVILDPAGAAQKTLTWLQLEEEEEEGPRDGGSGSGVLEEPRGRAPVTCATPSPKP